MMKIDLLVELFEKAGCDVEIDDDRVYITKVLQGINYDFVLGATYFDVYDLELSNIYLDVDFDFEYQLGCEESNYVTYFMNKFVEEDGPSLNNGIYLCETIINDWKAEEQTFRCSWWEFKNDLYKLIDLYEERCLI